MTSVLFQRGISVIGGGWRISLKGGVIYFVVLGFNSIFSNNIRTLFTTRNLFWSCWVILNKYNLYRFDCGFRSILPSKEPLIKFLTFLYIFVMLHVTKMLTKFWPLGTWKTASYKIIYMSQFITALFHRAKLKKETWLAACL